MPFRVLKRRCVLVGLKVGVDELDESVEILCGDLCIVSIVAKDGEKQILTASFS